MTHSRSPRNSLAIHEYVDAGKRRWASSRWRENRNPLADPEAVAKCSSLSPLGPVTGNDEDDFALHQSYQLKSPDQSMTVSGGQGGR